MALCWSKSLVALTLAACRSPGAEPVESPPSFHAPIEQERVVPWNIATDARDDRLLKSELERLAALPEAAIWPIARELQIASQVALTSNGIERFERDLPRELPREIPPREEPDFRELFEDEAAEPEQALIFTSPGAERIGEPAPCTVPEAIVQRDVPTVRAELRLETSCARGPSGHSIVLYLARRGDRREAWSVIHFYDSAFESLGHTGRSPESWNNSKGHSHDSFTVFATFTVNELPSPIFVTNEWCDGFVLHSFLPNGHFARVVVPRLAFRGAIGRDR